MTCCKVPIVDESSCAGAAGVVAQYCATATSASSATCNVLLCDPRCAYRSAWPPYVALTAPASGIALPTSSLVSDDLTIAFWGLLTDSTSSSK